MNTPPPYPEFVDGMSSTINDLDKSFFPLEALWEYQTAGHRLDIAKRNIFYAKKPTSQHVAELYRQSVRMEASMQAIEHPDHMGYIEGAKVQNAINKAGPDGINVLHGLIGILTEASELAELLFKWLDGEELDLDNMLEELGDKQFYTQLLMNACNRIDPKKRFTAAKVEAANMAKLRIRYATDFDVNLNSGAERNYEKERIAMAEAVEEEHIDAPAVS